MREINRIILHCSATPEGRNVTIGTIRKWHTDPKNKGGRGWTDIGYHYIILLDGTIERGRPIERAGAHCYGKNKDSIGICYIGGVDAYGRNPKDTRTIQQKHAFKILLETLQDQYPNVTIHGHYEFSSKACPSFNVEEYAR